MTGQKETGTTSAILLGVAQDAGVPQAGCACAHCQAAQADPTRQQFVVSLGLIDPATGTAWLIDATPDIRRQVHLLRQAAPGCELAGILLTHAHMGHYTGLIHLGPEGWNTRRLPVYASPRMNGFLLRNQPWRHLVQNGNIALHPLRPGEERTLSPALAVQPLPVPHRDEWSDTLAFVVTGPRRRLFYCPDIDGWDRWPRNLPDFLQGVDVALLDGSFYSPAELPGRDIADIPHPLATDTAARIANARAGGLATDVRLIHLNHTNPLWHDGPERRQMQAQGVGIGQTGDRWAL